MARVFVNSRSLGLVGATMSIAGSLCSAQTDRPTTNQLPTLSQQQVNQPARALPQAGIIQLQPPAPVALPQVIQHPVLTATVISAPAYVYPVITPAATNMAAAPVINAPVIGQPAPAAPGNQAQITPQLFGLLTLPMLPAATPGQPVPAGPTVLGDLSRPGPKGGTDTTQVQGGFGPLALADLSKTSASPINKAQNETATTGQTGGYLNLPTLSYVLLGFDQSGTVKSAQPAQAKEPTATPPAVQL